MLYDGRNSILFRRNVLFTTNLDFWNRGKENTLVRKNDKHEDHYGELVSVHAFVLCE